MLALIALGLTSPTGVLAQEIQDVKILNHYFTHQIRGLGKEFKLTTLSLKDPAATRLVVLNLSAQAKQAEANYTFDDFAIRFVNPKGEKERANCVGLGDGRSIFVSKVSVKVKKPGPFTFSLAFVIDAGVDEIELLSRFAPTSPKYQIGKARPVSISIKTIGDAGALKKMKDLVIKAGFHVADTGEQLNKDTRGVHIHHNPRVSKEVQKLAQDIKNESGITPQTGLLEKTNILAGYDILIWVGK
jgi:hypothetical protein